MACIEQDAAGCELKHKRAKEQMQFSRSVCEQLCVLQEVPRQSGFWGFGAGKKVRLLFLAVCTP